MLKKPQHRRYDQQQQQHLERQSQYHLADVQQERHQRDRHQDHKGDHEQLQNSLDKHGGVLAWDKHLEGGKGSAGATAPTYYQYSAVTERSCSVV